MDYNPLTLDPTLRAQLILPTTLKSTTEITVVCGCSKRTTLTYRAFLRKWGHKSRYLCKSCHVSSYTNDPNRINKFKRSFAVVARSQLHRARCSESGKKAWATPERRQALIDSIVADNRTNPKKAAARAVALKALQAKPWYIAHMDYMRRVSSEQTRSNVDRFVERAVHVHGDYYDYSLVQYTNNNTNVTITCPTHGQFQQTPHNHLQGKACRHCSCLVSSPHRAVVAMIEGLTTIEINNETVISPLELDVWLPDYQVAIEINGEYWHGVKAGMTPTEATRQRYRHRYKADIANAVGIKLLQFWADEIHEKPNLIKSMILNSIGMTANTVYARKCQVGQPTAAEAASFFHVNHLQGHRDAKIYYGLFYEQKLMCALSLNRHPVYEWEVIRYGVAAGVSVPGGFSRLLKMFEREHHPSQIMTFADKRISTGDLYLKNGFELIEDTTPNYFYWNRNEKLSRQQCQKSKLVSVLGDRFDPSLSEVRNMLAASYIQVFDAGHRKLLKRISQITEV